MPKNEEIMKHFNILPKLRLSRKEKKIVKLLSRAEQPLEYLSIIRLLNMRPSKFDKCIRYLSLVGLIYLNEENYYELTALAYEYLSKSKSELKSEKKFRKFINSLDEQQKTEFEALWKQIQDQKTGEKQKTADKELFIEELPENKETETVEIQFTKQKNADFFATNIKDESAVVLKVVQQPKEEPKKEEEEFIEF